MRIDLRRCLVVGSLGILSWWTTSPLRAASPSVDDALKLRPVQADIEYEKPSAEETAKCTIKAEKIGDLTGWVVRNPEGRILRRFVDTNGDNVVDQWSYFDNGIEIYRDIDANHDSKAEQFRWLNTGGSRWGLDTDSDGKLDKWKQISAEEVTNEIIRALATKDAARFQRVLLTPEEIKSLELGADQQKQLTEKIAAALEQFKTVAAKQDKLKADTTWLNFGGSRPGSVPAGTEGSAKDLLVYENVVSLVESGGENQQVQIGTLVGLDNAWRVITAPALTDDKDADLGDLGFFYRGPYAGRNESGTAGNSGTNERFQKLFDELEAVDKVAASAENQGPATKKRIEILEQLVDAAENDDKLQWVRQLADQISVAVQQGDNADGVAKLGALLTKVQATGDAELIAYVRFRQMTAEYTLALQAPTADFAKIQEGWLKNLEQFVKDYPQSADAAEALLQLGIAYEFAGQEDDAKKWYGELATRFPEAASAKKAIGAKTRLGCVGKPIVLKGKSTAGEPIDLAKLNGKLVLVHYWATWCEPCKADMAQLKELQGKFGKDGFALIGVCLDNNPKDLGEFLKKNRLPWPQLFEAGGLDSRLANEMGILTLPTMLLVDKQGKVVNRNIHITEVEKEITSRLK